MEVGALGMRFWGGLWGLLIYSEIPYDAIFSNKYLALRANVRKALQNLTNFFAIAFIISDIV